MKLVIVQRQQFMFFGVQAIAGFLQPRGHPTAAVIVPRERDYLQRIRQEQPDLIGVSVLSNDHGWLRQVTAELKAVFPAIPIIVGGAHTLFCPDLITWPAIDLVCVGEGEQVLATLLARMAAGADYSDIPGLQVKTPAGVRRNPPSGLLDDLDGSDDDREVYLRPYPELGRDAVLSMWTSRGCPLSCTFCVNRLAQEYYGAAARGVRRKSPARVVAEIVRWRQRLPQIRTVYFADDVFNCAPDYLDDFLPRYRREVGLPFSLNVFPGQITPAVAAALAAAGCRLLQVAPETANEEQRRRIFGKPTATADYLRMARAAHAHHILVFTAIVFIYPEQTVADALATVTLAREMGTDVPFLSYLIPYPGTEMHRLARRAGMLDDDYSFDDIPRSFMLTSSLRHPQRRELLRLGDWFYFLVRWPWLHRVVTRWPRLLQLFPGSRLANYAGRFLGFRVWKRLSAREAFRYLWRFRHDR